ncbi:hypothetical protein LIER_12328 [Lithospermum erythrorhizon]|uniref:Uncharacterized protein n=1 Tax=Lithospermum erythrorhizon TaxID=34254 RepID=A0AAV3PRB2_LITER
MVANTSISYNEDSSMQLLHQETFLDKFYQRSVAFIHKPGESNPLLPLARSLLVEGKQSARQSLQAALVLSSLHHPCRLRLLEHKKRQNQQKYSTQMSFLQPEISPNQEESCHQGQNQLILEIQ